MLAIVSVIGVVFPPSTTLSSTPSTVTSWEMFQVSSVNVNVNVSDDTVTPAGSSDPTVSTTLETG